MKRDALLPVKAARLLANETDRFLDSLPSSIRLQLFALRAEAPGVDVQVIVSGRALLALFQSQADAAQVIVERAAKRAARAAQGDMPAAGGPA